MSSSWLPIGMESKFFRLREAARSGFSDRIKFTVGRGASELEADSLALVRFGASTFDPKAELGDRV